MRHIIFYLFFIFFSTQKAHALTPSIYENLHAIGAYHRECQHLTVKGSSLHCSDRSNGDFKNVSKIVISTYAAASVDKIDHLAKAVFPGYLRLCDSFVGKSKNFDAFCNHIRKNPPLFDLQKQDAIHNLHFVRSYAQITGTFSSITVVDSLLKMNEISQEENSSETSEVASVLQATYDLVKLKEFGLLGLARTTVPGLKNLAKYYEHIAGEISDQALTILEDLRQSEVEPYPWQAMLEAANQVYYYNDEADIAVSGFSTDEGFISDGFAAISFIDHAGRQVIIAYRGTNFDDKFPWYANPNVHVNTAIGMENRQRALMTLPMLSAVGGSLLGIPAGLLGVLTGFGVDLVKNRSNSTRSWARTLGFSLGCAGFFLGAVIPATIVYVIYATWGQKRFSSYLSHSGNFASQIWLGLKKRGLHNYRVHVVGHSLGGYLAQHAALLHNFDGIGFNSPSIESNELRYLRRHYHGEFYNFHLDRDYFSLLFSQGAIGALLVHSHRPNDFSGNIVDFHRMSSIVEYFGKNPTLDIFK